MYLDLVPISPIALRVRVGCRDICWAQSVKWRFTADILKSRQDFEDVSASQRHA